MRSDLNLIREQIMGDYFDLTTKQFAEKVLRFTREQIDVVTEALLFDQTDESDDLIEHIEQICKRNLKK